MEDKSGRLILVALIAVLGFALIIGYAFWPGSSEELALGTYATLDQGFGTSGSFVFDLDYEDRVVDLAALHDGRVALAVNAHSDSGRSTPVLAMLSEQGAPDPRWGTSGLARLDFGRDAEARSMAPQPDGRLLVVGDILQADGSGRNLLIARLDEAGGLDPSFDEDGWIEFDHGFGDQRGLDILVLDDGRLLVGGWLRMNDENRDVAVLRLNPDGRLDEAFGNGGLQTLRHGIRSKHQAAHALLVVERGEILALGDRAEDPAQPPRAGAARFLAAGQPDPTFGSRGYRSDYPHDPEGSAFTAGLLDATGAVLVGGRLGSEWSGEQDRAPDARLMLLRLLPDGEVDPDYRGGKLRVGVDDLSLGVLDLAGLADGRSMVLTGVPDGKEVRPLLIALRSNGSLDQSFSDDGRALLDARQVAGNARLALQVLDDRPLIAMEVSGQGGGSDVQIMRLDESATFGSR